MMKKVTIIGATGSLGRAVTKRLTEENVELTLVSRSITDSLEPKGARVLAGNVMDAAIVEEAVQDADVVFVALSGNLPQMVTTIVGAMEVVGTKRLIFIASYGIYGELPGQNGRVASVLAPYRQAADLIEESSLVYTILRPGWFDNSSDRSYQLIPKREVIYGNEISRLAIADVVASIVENPTIYMKDNLGIVR